MIEIREVLWLAGHSLREVTRLAGLDRKTVRRYVQAAEAACGVSEVGPVANEKPEAISPIICRRHVKSAAVDRTNVALTGNGTNALSNNVLRSTPA